MQNEKEPCKPGGCSKMGCDGGHYCFNADGTPKVMSEEKKAELDAALREIFPQKGVGVISPPGERRKKLSSEQRQRMDDVKAKYEKAIDAAETRHKRRLRLSRWGVAIMHILVVAGAIYYVVIPLVKYLIKLLQH